MVHALQKFGVTWMTTVTRARTLTPTHTNPHMADLPQLNLVGIPQGQYEEDETVLDLNTAQFHTYVFDPDKTLGELLEEFELKEEGRFLPALVFVADETVYQVFDPDVASNLAYFDAEGNAAELEEFIQDFAAEVRHQIHGIENMHVELLELPITTTLLHVVNMTGAQILVVDNDEWGE